ncbi:MAG: hypothetical protein ACTHJR_07930 [Sphingomonas sp.]|uniref:hypothetical protein n=1 Tax=Sphingomonas sp. TaxID=28214 RepID=UPI003F7FCB79
MLALVRSLAAGGGALSPHDTDAWIRANTDLTTRMPSVTKLSAAEHFEREIRFGRQELAEAGLLATVGGAWRLLDAEAVDMTAEQAREITRQNTRRRRDAKSADRGVKIRRPHSGRSPRATKGPRPVDWRGTVTRETGPASTYLFRFEGSHIWKIGFAANVEVRLREVNRHIPIELLDRRWVLIRSQPWASSELAYQMEQKVLEGLNSKRTVYERVECSEAEALKMWVQALADFASENFHSNS